MQIKPFNGTDTSKILALLHRDCSPEQIVSIQFRAEVPPARTVAIEDQWLRLKSILGCLDVYKAFEISTLPIKCPATFYYSKGLEVIGTLANLLNRGGIHRCFVGDFDQALTHAREHLDDALSRDYGDAEAYSCHGAWCDWFLGEDVLDETVLLGNRGDWWLLTVTGTD